MTTTTNHAVFFDGNRKHHKFSSYIFLVYALTTGNLTIAAEQWGWKAEIRAGTTVEASDPATYPNQTQAEAAMRALLPPASSILTKASPGHGSSNGGSVQIEFTAPQSPIIYGQPIYTTGLNPIFFGFPPDLSNPLNASSDDELADAINARLKAQGPAACANEDRGVLVDPLWGPGWILVGSTPGAVNITGKQYTFTEWTVTNSNICFSAGSNVGNVWRTTEANCPAGYNRLSSQDPNSGGYCFSTKTGVVRGTPHQCEVTPISTSVGNPCDTVTGAKTESETDYSSDTIALTRSYNSHAQMQSSFGPGWMHNYDRRLSITRATPGSSFAPSMLLRPSGVSNLLRGFSSNGESVWQSTSGNGLLVKQEGAQYRNYLRSGATELYDSNGLLIELVNAAGRVTTIDRDGQGLVTGVTGPFGKTLTFNYDADLQLMSIDDPAGNTIQYGYGGNGELISVTNQDNTFRQYHYEDPSFPYHLTGITDENGDRFSTFTFDATGRTITTEHAGGFERLELEYLPTQTVVTDAAGTQRTFQFTTDTTKLRKLTALVESDATTTVISPTFTSDWQRRPTQVIDPNGVVTEFSYDQFHVTQIIEAKGSPDERVTNFEYQSNNSNLVSSETTASVFTGMQRSVVTDFGGDNLQDSVTISGFTPDGIPIQRTIVTTYSPQGQIVSIDGPRTDIADVTTFDYYDCETGARCGQLESMTNAVGHVTTFDTYDDHGRVLQMTDPNGLASSFGYDSGGNVLTMTETPTAGAARVLTMTYDSMGQPETVTSPSGSVLTHSYDAAHNLTSITDNFGNTISYNYDSRGNRTDEDTFDSNNVLRRTLDKTFDIRNRVATINSGGFISTIMYDAVGNFMSETDPNLALTQHGYDALDRLQQTQDALLGLTDYSYDAHDNLTSISAPNGATTAFEYDDLGNLLNEISPDRGMIIYTHDSAGNVATTTDGRGKITSYSYDALNRVTEIRLDNQQTISFQYDTGINAIGRLNRITDASGETIWNYDQFGSETSKTQTIGTVSLTLSYVYDTAGRLTTMTLPSGKNLTIGYNAFLPTSVIVDSTTVLSGATYEPFGPVNSWTWGNTTVHSRNFDLRGLIDSQTLLTDTRTLAYDGAGQLISVDDGRQEPGFDYGDLFPNGATHNYSITPFTNRLASTTGPMPKTFTYDGAGNAISDSIHTYGYDDRGRLVSVDNGAAATYEHNGQGQRVKKVSGADTRLFVYDEAGNLIGEYDDLGNLIQEHVWFGGAPVAVLDGTNTYYVHTDHIGTPRVVSNGNTAIWQWESTPFGSTPADEDPDGDQENYSFNLRFPGQYYDVETALHYNYFRTYDPSTGRYLESDPIGLAAGPNTYAYVGNMPTMRVDPYGLFGMAGHSQARLEQARRDGKIPSGDQGLSAYAGYEYNFIAGSGVTLVSCQDNCGERRTMKFRKICGGAAIGASASVGPVAGLSGERCAPEYYEKWFLELGISAGYGWGMDIGLPLGVVEGGPAPGFGAQLFSFCYYIYMGDE